MYCHATHQIDSFLAAEQAADRREAMIDERVDQTLLDAAGLETVVWAEAGPIAAALVDFFAAQNAPEAAARVLHDRLRALARPHAADDVDDDLRDGPY